MEPIKENPDNEKSILATEDKIGFAIFNIKEGSDFKDTTPGFYYTVPAPTEDTEIPDIYLEGPFDTHDEAVLKATDFITDALSSGLRKEMIYTGNENNPDLSKTISMNVDDAEITMSAEEPDTEDREEE